MLLKIVLALLVLLVAVSLGWRALSNRRNLPCPSWFAWSLENPVTKIVPNILEYAGLRPGLRVLDAGCGAGRLTIPAAGSVGPGGEVVALDLQPGMLKKLEQRAAKAGAKNIRMIQGGIGQGLLEAGAFDRAFLSYVLGEIPEQDRKAGMEELYSALKPGGVLLIAESIPDPHFQGRDTVRRLAEEAGFTLRGFHGSRLSFVMALEKPAE